MTLFVIIPWGFYYLWLGYCHADAVRELGLLRRSPRFVGFLTMMLLWPMGVMMLADRIRLEKEAVVAITEKGKWQ